MRTASFRLLGVSLVIGLAGCAPISINELRQEAPTRTERLEADYADLGGCVLETLQTGERSEWSVQAANLSFESVTRKAQRKMTITGFSSHGMKVPIIDIVLTGHGERVTFVETRRGGVGEVRRGGRIVEEQAWPVIERCAIAQ